MLWNLPNQIKVSISTSATNFTENWIKFSFIFVIFYQIDEEADTLVTVDWGPGRTDRVARRRLNLLLPERTFRIEIVRVLVSARGLETVFSVLVDYRLRVPVVVVVSRRLLSGGKTVRLDIVRRRYRSVARDVWQRWIGATFDIWQQWVAFCGWSLKLQIKSIK